jgi:hypothetical protein
MNRLAVIILAGLSVLLPFFMSAAAAQGFSVEPLTVQVKARPGDIIQIPFTVRSGDASITSIQVTPVNLSQHQNGAFTFVQPGTEGVKVAHQSMLSSLRLSGTEIALEDFAAQEFIAELEVPFSARGYFFLALLFEQPPRLADTTGTIIQFRYLVPIIVNIEGRPVLQAVQIDDVALDFQNIDEDNARVTARLRVRNFGQTYSHVRGSIRVEKKEGKTWRLVTHLDTRDRPILPGTTINLGQDLDRSLPSGDYRLTGVLFVDGRQMQPMTREISFEGDPNIDTVAYNTELRLSPEIVAMDVVSGGVRTTVLTIANPGTEPVEVKLQSATPQVLSNALFAQNSGPEISAADWTQFRPDNFILPPGRQQNVRLISNLPATAEANASYYAELIMSGNYADGQSAGQQTSIMHLSNKLIEQTIAGSIAQLNLAEVGPGVYALQASLMNAGNTHFVPNGRAALSSALGIALRSVELSGQRGPLLPLGRRIMSGELDFNGIEPGLYSMQISMDLGGGKTTELQQIVEVETGATEAVDGSLIEGPIISIREGLELAPTDDTQANDG